MMRFVRGISGSYREVKNFSTVSLPVYVTHPVYITKPIFGEPQEEKCKEKINIYSNAKFTSPIPNLTNKSNLSLKFMTEILPECRIDGKLLKQNCRSPLDLHNVQDGEHLIEVIVRDECGYPIVATYGRFVVDTTPPETYITPGVGKYVASNTAPFTVTASEPSTFRCKVRDSPWYECYEKNLLTNLPEGSIIFYAQAQDKAGNFDPTPAEYEWYIDTKPPETHIKQREESKTTESIVFDFSSDEKDVKFLCKIDEGEWSECSTPHTVIVLPGKHKLYVISVDKIGNRDATPEIFEFGK